MRCFAKTEQSEWPNDEEWRAILPEWFLASFEGHNLEEILASDQLWHFESWLDAMKYRGWEWSSSVVNSELEWTVSLTIFDFPCSLEAFEYLARASGVELIVQSVQSPVSPEEPPQKKDE